MGNLTNPDEDVEHPGLHKNEKDALRLSFPIFIAEVSGNGLPILPTGRRSIQHNGGLDLLGVYLPCSHTDERSRTNIGCKERNRKENTRFEAR